MEAAVMEQVRFVLKLKAKVLTVFIESQTKLLWN
jgi:hypothetical protein